MIYLSYVQSFFWYNFRTLEILNVIFCLEPWSTELALASDCPSDQMEGHVVRALLETRAHFQPPSVQVESRCEPSTRTSLVTFLSVARDCATFLVKLRTYSPGT